jgi:DNA-binding MarR family transcriptional regulator
VKSGLLLRKEDPDNRRRQLVSLSAKGRAKAESINALCDRYYEGFLGGLPDKDAKAIVAALPAFVAALREWRLAEGAGGCRKGPKERQR